MSARVSHARASSLLDREPAAAIRSSLRGAQQKDPQDRFVAQHQRRELAHERLDRCAGAHALPRSVGVENCVLEADPRHLALVDCQDERLLGVDPRVDRADRNARTLAHLGQCERLVAVFLEQPSAGLEDTLE